MRTCAACGTELVRREREKPHRFAKRKTCGHACSRRLLVEMRPDTRFKGSDASGHSKRSRAQRKYPLDAVVCEEPGCEKQAVDRHHLNEDPGDNRRPNLEFLCRRHHRERHAPPEAPCITCGGPAPRGHRSKGRCRSCAAYILRTGRERPWKKDGRLEGSQRGIKKPALRTGPVECAECGVLTKPPRKGLCRKCYDRQRWARINAEKAEPLV